ncbi:MAG TPA: cyclodeaminase/cyclohydrolase family protein [Thermomicrobiales bacterium]|nr:cyclodeaminase/cyclohydrolase family protein [Thermomicrobiales bacterium]
MAERTLGAYLDAVASRAPTPGGGSVVGVVAAMAAGLGEMVCALSAKEGAPGDELRIVLGHLSALRERCLGLAAADEAVYAAYRAAASLPRGDEAERATRSGALREALVTATETPLLLAETCVGVLRALDVVARGGKKLLRSDVEIAVLLSDAALRGGLATARGNLGGLDDASRAAFVARADDLEGVAARSRDEVLGDLGGR